ncbi:MAG: acetyltransferase [Chlorobi bacterium]|nr:acetyltransferase [Chlorobiota bacterium]
MTPEFHQLTHADLDRLVAMMREYYLYDNLVFDEDVARNAASMLLEDESLGGIWLIRLDGVEVGYAVLAYSFSLEFHGRQAFVDELYVREAHRGRSIGTATLDFLAVFCGSRGIRALRLEVERENKPAQGLYRKIGFEQHDRYLMTRWLL